MSSREINKHKYRIIIQYAYISHLTPVHTRLNKADLGLKVSEITIDNL